MRPLEVWGGIEATVNRIGDAVQDQLTRSHHRSHPEDLERFAALGLRKLRYPLTWEIVAPDGLDRANWSWFDDRFARARALGLEPIAGLMHHGSGPRSTSLVADDFAQGLEAYARACAERFPWVRDWTPINEPLTTARFSALYGLWYPHARDDGLFARAIVNQCRATVLAMKQIRAVNPEARLIQPEDLGFATVRPALAYRAQFENERRWLTSDLLCGKVDRQHLFWTWLQKGVTEAELSFFLENPCPPDVIGLNYYVTSDRTLDERLELYPPEFHGGDDRQRFADIESVRTFAGLTGHEALIRQTWARYRLPIAFTEVHLDGVREEQLRWLHQAWAAANDTRADGIEVQAITVWALLGAFDWNSLLTRQTGYYEPGPFDLRAPKPRPTALATMVKALATEGHFEHPVLEGDGWWRRDERSTHNRARHAAKFLARARFRSGPGRPLLITGASTPLGRALAHACELRGLHHRLATLDVASAEAVDQVLDEVKPWAIINAAGYLQVRAAERDELLCRRANAEGPHVLALAAERRGAPLLTFSSDLVFDGQTQRAYVESDAPRPQTVFGASKAEGERRVLETCERSLVVRMGACFSPWDEESFLSRAALQLRRGEPVRVSAGELVSPTYLPDLVHCALDLLIDQERGVWHLASLGSVSWADFTCALAERLSRPKRLIVEEPPWIGPPAARCFALKSERAALMPALTGAIDRYLEELGGTP